MSKTNHRINRDREEKLRESKAHAARRQFKNKVELLVDLYDHEKDPDEIYEEVFDETEYESFVKIRRTR